MAGIDTRHSTAQPGGATALVGQIGAAARSAAAALYRTQRTDGSWVDWLPSAATSTASSAIALTLADPDGSAALIAGALRWLCADQAADGGWGEGPGEPASINATAMALAALKQAARRDPDGLAYADQLRRGFARFEQLGGMAALYDLEVASLGPVCQQYFALVGLFDEQAMVRIPIELSFFPAFIRRRFCFSFPGLMAWGLMQSAVRTAGPLRRLVNRAATPGALGFLRGVVEFEGPEGGFEESPLMVALVCIGTARAGIGADVRDHCVAYLRRTARPDGSWAVTRDLEFTVTALIAVGMHEVGLGDDPRLAAAAHWIRDCQMTRPFPPTGAPAGGWQWSQPSGWPGTLDTADGVSALAGFSPADPSAQRGVRWLLDMQNGDGSWSYFCRNSRLPVDSPCSLMTGHAMLALHEAAGLTAEDKPLAKAVEWIGRAQRPDGDIVTAWYLGSTPGTGSCLAALGRLGLAGHPTARRLRDWLVSHQNEDGGWGGGAGSASTVEETAWALLGLADGSGAECDEVVVRGARWLLGRQDAGGLWPAAHVSYYMHNLTFSSDHFANGYALQALGRVRRRMLG
jgi:squalene-hopene/tetraprenyl-beta-curcumene cyclase